MVSPYLAALCAEIRHYQNLFSNPPALCQMHWGGGSPSYLTIEEAASVISVLRQVFPDQAAGADISIELDPRTSDREKILFYRSAGFNRVSLGVQDLHPAVQEAVNRIQPFELVAETIASVREAGYSSLNVDLIYGLPEQTSDSFSATIAEVIRLCPDRIALYGYAHVTWLKKVQNTFKRFTLPSPEQRIELFLLALEALQSAGYLHIGMDHFALPSDGLAQACLDGTLHRNFMGYSTHRCPQLLAFGASAISKLPGVLAQNYRDLPTYQQSVSTSGLAVERGLLLSRDDELRGYVIDSLFCQSGLDVSAFETTWGEDFWDKFRPIRSRLDQLVTDGLVELDSGNIRLTSTGRLFTRNVAMLFDAYLPFRLAENRPVFSATV